MNRVGTGWLIKDVEEFWDECPCAKQLLDFADEQAKVDGVRWYFEKCYVQRDERSFTAIFGSYVVPPYDKYLLSINATLMGDQWEVRVVKKVTDLSS